MHYQESEYSNCLYFQSGHSSYKYHHFLINVTIIIVVITTTEIIVEATVVNFAI